MRAAHQFAMSKFYSKEERDAAMLKHIEELRAELAAANKDAERYRYIRQENSFKYPFLLRKENLDAALDKAMVR